MKHRYLTLALGLWCAAHVVAQHDTLLYEPFQTDNSADWVNFPYEDTDTLWINWDEDGKEAAGGFPSNFFYNLDWGQTNLMDSIPPTDTNFVIVARSWLVDFDTVSSNWFVTPALTLIDDQTTLHWKSAPFQGPRYMDGYAVKILVGANAYFEADEVVTVFRAAEMTGWIGDNSSLDLDSFTFSPGYIHADGFTDTTYFLPADSAQTSHLGLLEPHSVSLAQFAGQTIHVAFHHDSADDNLIMFDDILVLGNELVSTADDLARRLRFVTYPNPVDNWLNVLYRLEGSAQVDLAIHAADGKRLASWGSFQQPPGEHQHRLDLRGLPTGTYSFVLHVDGQPLAQQIVKR